MFTVIMISMSLALLIVTVVSTSALAQDKVLQRDVNLFAQTIDGTPRLCGIEFFYVFADNTISLGKVTGLKGSLTLMVYNNQPSLMIKTVGRDFNELPASTKSVPFIVNNTTVTVAERTVQPRRTPCNELENYCGSFDSPNDITAILKNILSHDSSVAINFNRHPGDMDNSLKLDRTPWPTQDMDEYNSGSVQFFSCLKNLGS